MGRPGSGSTAGSVLGWRLFGHQEERLIGQRKGTQWGEALLSLEELCLLPWHWRRGADCLMRGLGTITASVWGERGEIHLPREELSSLEACFIPQGAMQRHRGGANPAGAQS